MQQQVDRSAGTPTEAGMLAMQSVTAASLGQVRRARELTQRAIDLATSRGLKQGAALYSAGDSLWEAAYGDCQAAKRSTARTRRSSCWTTGFMSSRSGPLSSEMARRRSTSRSSPFWREQDRVDPSDADRR